MNAQPLLGKTILITGAARRVGKIFALACARAGADVVIHHGHSQQEALDLQEEIASLRRRSWVLPADLSQPAESSRLIARAAGFAPLDALVNNAAIFEPLSVLQTSFEDWQRHMNINLTAPFLLSQAFAKHLKGRTGRIVNILDWRALRPGADHFPYTISKAALAAMTQSLAAALAPDITVNGLALGAILPPADANSATADETFLKKIPARRWSESKEAQDALLFLLAGPAYITGEIIHLDGGRHLV